MKIKIGCDPSSDKLVYSSGGEGGGASGVSFFDGVDWANMPVFDEHIL